MRTRPADVSPSPLSRREIHELLKSLATQPPDVFWATTLSLYGWCKPTDVNAALALLDAMPIPRCANGNAENGGSAGTSVQRAAASN